MVSNDTSICIGNGAQLNASGGTNYSWSPSNGLNNSSIANPITTPSVTTNYTVEITNMYGCTVEDNVLVTAASLPIISISNDTSICNGSSLPLFASGGSFYSWSPSNGLNNSTISNPIATPASSITYHVNVTNVTGCTAEDSVVVTVNSLPTPIVNTDTTVCYGTSAQLNASGGVSYSWSPATGLNNSAISDPLANPLVTTSYTVTVTDAAGCSSSSSTAVIIDPLPAVLISNDTSICLGTVASLQVGGGTSYSWSPTNDLDNPSIANPEANPNSTTTYYVVVSDNIGCTATDSVTVTVNPIPVPVVSNDTAICTGTFASLIASGGVSYSWSPFAGLNNSSIPNPLANPLTTTTYYVTVADVIGCSALDSVVVYINPLPQPIVSSDTTICKGTIASLDASGGILYNWSNGDSGDHIDVSPIISTAYDVAVTDSNSCVATATVVVSVDLLQVIINGDDEICIGENTQLQASGAINYLWSNNSLLSYIIVAPETDSVFSVTGNDGLCADTTEFTVHVNQLPVADAGPDVSIVLNDVINLTANGGISCIWSPPDGLSCTNCCDPIASPHDTTTYAVTITDIHGCSSIDSVTVIVIPPDDVLFPDAFTPNGDGLNDEFAPILSGHTEMKELQVYNRWGELVFVSTNRYSGWNGTYKGKPESIGTYVYSFIGFNTINGKTIYKKGNVTVLR